MPQGMQDIGTQMHRAASRFAVDAQNGSVSSDGYGLSPMSQGRAFERVGWLMGFEPTTTGITNR
jgi:hypothetical protein